MKTRKKGLLGFSMALLMAASFAVPAFANDHYDRQYSFIFSKKYNSTDFYYKEDSSPVYVRCVSASHQWFANVWAGLHESDNMSMMASVSMTTGSEKFVSVPYNSQYVYGIIGEPTYWDSSAWGYWSPDSV